MDKKNMSYEDILFRIGYFRNKNNFRELIELEKRKSVELKVSTLMNFMELCNITPEEFFYYNPENYEKDKDLLQIIKSLSNENKDALIDMAKRLK